MPKGESQREEAIPSTNEEVYSLYSLEDLFAESGEDKKTEEGKATDARYLQKDKPEVDDAENPDVALQGRFCTIFKKSLGCTR